MTTVKPVETEAAAQAETVNDDDQGMTHYFCCLDDRGICGTKLDGDFDEDDEEPAECVVCRAMEDQPCEVTCHPYLTEAS